MIAPSLRVRPTLVCTAAILLIACIAAPAAPAGSSAPAQPPADAGSALAAVRADEAARVALFERIAPSVVCLYENAARGGGGSGVIIDSRGYGLTNFHVVESMLARRRGVGGLNDGRLYPLRVLGVDVGGDVAMFKLEGRDSFPAAPLGDSDRLAVGQSVAALGNPFLLAENYTPTVTLGVISGLHRYQAGEGNMLEYADCIQVATSINPGNSGGPLFDLAGRVIGINGRISVEQRGRVNVGLGYAISINQIKRFLPGLRAGRLLEHGTLGATVQIAGNTLIFNAVQERSPAELAGVKLGDELVAVGDRALHTPNDFNNAIALLPADWPVSLRIRRDGKEQMLSARLERVPVKLAAPFIADLDHNHDELRMLLQRFAGRDAGFDRSSVARMHLQLKVQSAQSESDTLALDWQTGGSPVFSNPSSAQAAPPGSQPAETASAWAGVDAARRGLLEPLLAQWWDIQRPLLSTPELGVGWEYIGGDELEGRVVAVVEHRETGGQRLRWKFDYDGGQFLQATVGHEQQPEAITWDASGRISAGKISWPQHWLRREAGQADVRVEIESGRIELLAPTSQEAPP